MRGRRRVWLFIDDDQGQGPPVQGFSLLFCVSLVGVEKPGFALKKVQKSETDPRLSLFLPFFTLLVYIVFSVGEHTANTTVKSAKVGFELRQRRQRTGPPSLDI